MRFVYASNSVSVQISPTLCTSLMSAPAGASGTPVGSVDIWRMCWNVNGFFAMSLEYGARRMPKYEPSLEMPARRVLRERVRLAAVEGVAVANATS